MSNNNVQGAIPLAGKGYYPRLKGNYESGEYRQFSNVTFDDAGFIKNRRNVQGAGPDFLTNGFGIIGHVPSGVISASATKQIKNDEFGNSFVLWAPNLLPVPAGANSFHRLVKFVYYNKSFYWITLEYDSTNNLINVCAYWVNPGFNDISTIAFGGLTRVVLFTLPTLQEYPVVNAVFIHKDRLWIETNHYVYFSKATDPLTFTVPNGGFLTVPDTNIRYCFALNDAVYILCDGQVQVFSYSITPDDGYLRPISKDVGGVWGCVHQGTPYMINEIGLYTLTNGNVDKVLDTNFDKIWSSTYQLTYKIESFGKYLVILRRNYVNFANLAQSDARYNNNAGFVYTYDATVDGNGESVLDNWNCFLLDTQSGVLSVLDFTDRNDQAIASRGFIVDAYYNPVRGLSSDTWCFFMTSGITAVGPPIASKNHVYKMINRPVDPLVYDESYDSADVLRRYKPRILLEIVNYTPDGNEYLMKKFRYLEAMAKFPSSDMAIQISMEDQAYKAAVNVLNDNQANMKLDSPARLPINQRAKSISVKVITNNPTTSLGAGIWDQFQLSDLRVLWTYLQRNRVHRTDTVASGYKNI